MFNKKKNVVVKVEIFDPELAKADLEGKEEMFKNKITDGIGEDIEEIEVDPVEIPEVL